MDLNCLVIFTSLRIFIEDENFKLWTILENSADMDSNHDSLIVLYHFALG